MKFIIWVDIILIVTSYFLIMGGSGKFILKPSFFFFALFIQAYLIGIIWTTLYNPYNLLLKPDKLILFNLVPHIYLFFIALGTVFTRALFKFRKKEINQFKNKKYFIESNKTSFYIINTVATLMSLILAMLYFKDGIPFFADNKEAMRVEMIRGGGYFFLSITLLLPLFSFNGWIYAKHKKDVAFKIFYVFMICINILLMILSMFKSPIARIVLILFIFYMLFKKKKVNLKKLIYPITIICIIIFSFILFSMGDAEHAFEYLIKRLFLMNSYDLYHIFEYFPESIDFLWGKGLIMDIKALAPGPGISFDGWMYSLIYPYYQQAGINSSVGEIWAEVGMLFPMVAFFWGGLLELVFIKFIRDPQTVSNILFYSFYVFGLGNTSGGITSKTFSFVLPLAICHFLFKYGKMLITAKGRTKYKEIP